MKFLFRIFLLLLLAAAGVVFWRFGQKGEYNSENLKSAYQETNSEAREKIDEGLAKLRQKADETGIAGATERARDRALEFGRAAREKFDAVDWKKLKSDFGLGDKELTDYLNSLAWIFDKNEESGNRPAATPNTEEVTTPGAPPASGTDQAPKLPAKTSAQTAAEPDPPSGNPLAATRAPSEATKQARPVPGQAADIPAAKPAAPALPASYARGHEILKRAKAQSRQALPGMQRHDEHLKESVKLYQQSVIEFEKTLADPTLPASQRREIEGLLPKINQQIYWGKKLGKI